MKKNNISIFIDADASPVVNGVIHLREELNVSVILIHSRAHIRNKELPADVQTVIVEAGPDAADYEIIRRAKSGDIAVTEDLGLSSILLAKGVHVINAHGKIISQMEMDSLLEVRHAAQKERRSGKRVKGPKKRKQEDEEQFLEKLRELVKLST
ncbi:DUF188 domain-containing protein [Alkalicoccus daliensis]|uniref:UPF0178 protein SAMN04488053_101832 n=1 Tax=Alkalicoccus daliensis TaxID=745820 RepID=A0A1H0BBU6_9BACI|nr:DUF188 domain-containing protein [Alkalicoccus daliensis]SDN43119.1 hypothetical protein SAMN04488053_101832 [Alkalicoccus daliensis]